MGGGLLDSDSLNGQQGTLRTWGSVATQLHPGCSMTPARASSSKFTWILLCHRTAEIPGGVGERAPQEDLNEEPDPPVG